MGKMVIYWRIFTALWYPYGWWLHQWTCHFRGNATGRQQPGIRSLCVWRIAANREIVLSNLDASARAYNITIWELDSKIVSLQNDSTKSSARAKKTGKAI